MDYAAPACGGKLGCKGHPSCASSATYGGLDCGGKFGGKGAFDGACSEGCGAPACSEKFGGTGDCNPSGASGSAGKAVSQGRRGILRGQSPQKKSAAEEVLRNYELYASQMFARSAAACGGKGQAGAGVASEGGASAAARVTFAESGGSLGTGAGPPSAGPMQNACNPACSSRGCGIHGSSCAGGGADGSLGRAPCSDQHRCGPQPGGRCAMPQPDLAASSGGRCTGGASAAARFAAAEGGGSFSAGAGPLQNTGNPACNWQSGRGSHGSGCAGGGANRAPGCAPCSDQHGCRPQPGARCAMPQPMAGCDSAVGPGGRRGGPGPCHEMQCRAPSSCQPRQAPPPSAEAAAQMAAREQLAAQLDGVISRLETANDSSEVIDDLRAIEASYSACQNTHCSG